MTTTTQTQAPAPAVRACPPSAVADQIVRWSAVKAGDLLLHEDTLIVAEEVRVYEDDWQGHKWLRVDITYLSEDGHRFTTDRHGDRWTAVRRYTEGAEITLTAGKARTAAAGLDEAADDRCERAGTVCRDCAESPQRYCEGCQDSLDTAAEYRQVRDELIRAAGSGEARGG